MSEIACPKCSSTQLTTNKRGFNVKKAIGGVLIPGGILWGLHGKDKIVITCLSCGHSFKPGEGKNIKTNFNEHGQTDTKNISTESTGSTSDGILGCAVMIVILIAIVVIIRSCR